MYEYHVAAMVNGDLDNLYNRRAFETFNLAMRHFSVITTDMHRIERDGSLVIVEQLDGADLRILAEFNRNSLYRIPGA